MTKLSKKVRAVTTEHKRMESALIEQKYRVLFESLNDAVFLADAETGYIVDTNNQGEMLLGRTRDEIIGMHQSELHPPKASNEYRQRFATHVQKGRAADYDGMIIRKDGSTVPVNISASTITIGRKQLMLGLFRDITELKRAEEALREDEERFHAITSSAHDAIIIMDDTGKIHYWNRAAEKIFGYSVEEVSGKAMHTLIMPQHYRQAYQKGLSTFRVTGQAPVSGLVLELPAVSFLRLYDHPFSS